MIPRIRSASVLSNIVHRNPMKISQYQSSTFVKTLNHSIDSLPLREAAFYKNKYLRWTAEKFRVISVAHANALLDMGLVPGDRVAVWLANDKAEKHVAMLAAAISGFTIIDVNPEDLTTVADVRGFLKVANCKMIYFDPVSDTTKCLELLRKAIPEFYYYDDTHGQSFHSKYFPSMKYFIHTGFDLEMGCINYKTLYITDPIMKDFVKEVSSLLADDTLAYVKAFKGPSEWTLGTPITHKDILNHESWHFAKKIVNKEFFEGY